MAIISNTYCKPLQTYPNNRVFSESCIHVFIRVYWQLMYFHVDKEHINTEMDKTLSYYYRTTIIRSFVRDYPGEPVPEETLTHIQS